MLINEYRLVVTDPQARSLLRSAMKEFLFREGATETKEASETKGVS
jgi:Fe-S cluster biosynthesis and repair protein YggX